MQPLTPTEQFVQEYDAFGNKTNALIPHSNQPNSLPGAIPDVVSAPTNPGSSMSGQILSEINNTKGVIYSSKKSFTDTTSGYRLGIDTDNKSKFYIGSSSNSLLWDGTNLTIVGSITGGSLNINNKFTVSSSGDVVMKSYSLISQYTYGESITPGKLLCLKNGTFSWGDGTVTPNNPSINKSTTSSFSAFTYVDSANPNTAYGVTNLAHLGSDGGGQRWIYAKMDTSTVLPGFNELESIKLRMYVVFASDGSLGTPQVQISALNGAFTESSVTWNTKPGDDGIVWSSSVTCISFNGETCATTNDVLHTGYIEFDITDLYRLWSSTLKTNNGFVIKLSTQTGTDAQIGTRSRSGGGVYNQAPFEVVLITADNAGVSSFTACDGKAYLASNADYQLVKNIIGISGSTAGAGVVGDVYTLADRSLIPNTVFTVINNKTYYLNGTDGTISTLTNDVIESGKWDLKIGTGTPNGLSIDFDKNPIYIKQGSYFTGGVLPPPNARMAIVDFSLNDVNSKLQQASLVVSKPFHTTSSWSDPQSPNGGLTFSANWASGTMGLFSVSAGLNALRWYR